MEKSLIARVGWFFEKIAILCLAVIATLIFIQIILRNLFSLAFVGFEEVARLAHITMVFLLVPVLYREGMHVTIDIVLQKSPPAVRRLLTIFSTLLTAAYGLFFLFSEYQFMLKNATVPSPGLGIPNIVFFSGAYVGMTFLVLTAVEMLLRQLKGRKDGGAHERV